MKATWRPTPLRFGKNFKMNRDSKGLVSSISLRFLGMWFILWSRRGRRGLSYIDGPGSLNFQVRKNSKSARRQDGEVTQPSEGGFFIGGIVKVLGIIALVIFGMVCLAFDVPGNIALLLP